MTTVLPLVTRDGPRYPPRESAQCCHTPASAPAINPSSSRNFVAILQLFSLKQDQKDSNATMNNALALGMCSTLSEISSYTSDAGRCKSLQHGEKSIK